MLFKMLQSLFQETIACVVCNTPEKDDLDIYSHRTETGNICGIVVLCTKCASIYAGGEVHLTPRKDELDEDEKEKGEVK